jgi:hypothetical protein
MSNPQNLQAQLEVSNGAHAGRSPASVLHEAQGGQPAAEPPGDDLNDELQAMRSMARTLEKLDYEARQRVLNWLLHRNAPPPGLVGLAQSTGGPWNVPR